MNTIDYHITRNTTQSETVAGSFTQLQNRGRRCSITNELPVIVRNEKGEFAQYKDGECVAASRGCWLD